jgi:uracil-DNA glycosylase family 4
VEPEEPPPFEAPADNDPIPGPPDWIAGAADLKALELAARACDMCPLSGAKKGFLFGRGKESGPAVMFVVAPQGKAAVKEGAFPAGKEGALLSKMIAGGFKLEESELFVTPAVKCAVDLKGPLPRRARVCCGYITARQAELLAPRAVVAMGPDAARVMSRTDKPLGLLRGRLRKLAAGQWKAWLWTTYGLDRMCAKQGVKEDAWDDLAALAQWLRQPPGAPQP